MEVYLDGQNQIVIVLIYNRRKLIPRMRNISTRLGNTEAKIGLLPKEMALKLQRFIFE